jgi:hypothetical protein
LFVAAEVSRRYHAVDAALFFAGVNIVNDETFYWRYFSPV